MKIISFSLVAAFYILSIATSVHASEASSINSRKMILDSNPELLTYVNLALTKKLDSTYGSNEAETLNKQGDSIYGMTHGLLREAQYNEFAKSVLVGPAYLTILGHTNCSAKIYFEVDKTTAKVVVKKVDSLYSATEPGEQVCIEKFEKLLK